ncbi:MAG: AraC family transcriptional regulator [Spirochaetaceae bacterium]
MIKEDSLVEIYQLFNNSKIRTYQHGYDKIGTNWYYNKRRDPYNRLYIITTGEGYLESPVKKIPLTVGNAYFIPRDVTYTMGTKTNIGMFWVHFDLELYPGFDMGDSKNCVEIIPYLMDENDPVCSIIYSRNPGDILILKSRILYICGLFLNSFEKSYGKDYKLIQKYKLIFPYFWEKIDANLPISNLSDIMGMSYTTFYRHFNTDFGCSPKDFMQNKVIQKASHLLIHSTKPTKEIAANLGFHEASYFSKLFKKRTGKSPSLYRKEFLYIPEIAGKKPVWDTNVSGNE